MYAVTYILIAYAFNVGNGFSLIMFFNQLEFIGAVLSLDGSKCLKESHSIEIKTPTQKSNEFVVTKSMVIIDASYEDPVLAAEEVGRKVAQALKDNGATKILEVARKEILLAQNDLRQPKSS